jgi:3-hydroxyisobutyrate dehydrogenase-like beta-hydroxyacid dehydrogenase
MIAPAAATSAKASSRIVKICHNVFLGVVTQSLAEITILAQKAGVPRCVSHVHERQRHGLDVTRRLRSSIWTR